MDECTCATTYLPPCAYCSTAKRLDKFIGNKFEDYATFAAEFATMPHDYIAKKILGTFNNTAAVDPWVIESPKPTQSEQDNMSPVIQQQVEKMKHLLKKQEDVVEKYVRRSTRRRGSSKLNWTSRRVELILVNHG